MDSSMVGVPARGLDVSHHNVDNRGGPINWSAVVEAGYTFVFVKASDGATWHDPRFIENASAALAAGLQVGAYHFLRPGSDATAQAHNYLKQVILAGGPEILTLGAAVDVEDPDDDPGAWDGIDQATRILKVSHWLDVVDAALGRPSFIYCAPPWWAQALGTGADFSGHPLWAAHPGTNEPVLTGTCWSKWSIWQYDFHGTVPGVGMRSVDLNRAHVPPIAQ